ncbi:Ankyrin repeat family protein [Hibiscus syriacus]|uniref:Ankyrin repeat family protein n=1 Tax=Hibiscus syriacus TaxID=106335 RepID=A0A6A2Y9K4_HIBSY|nr:Ankyrin repeat family protein [Hibiscus syriacus]
MQFAMEMINLKLSFARNLNQQGLSPLHIAVEKRHKVMMLLLLEIDSNLAHVKGKKGETPLHYISKVGNHDGLLDRFLEACPDSILNEEDYHHKVVNQKDEDGNTALHLAASNNQLQMLQLLLNCKADKHATNQDGLTAVRIAQQHDNRECITLLQGCFIPVISKIKCKSEKQLLKYAKKASSLIFHDMDNISSDDRNALLVILALLLTATYQAALSPPGGIWQGDNTSKYKGSYDQTVPGTSDSTSSTTCCFRSMLRPINKVHCTHQISTSCYDYISGNGLYFNRVHVTKLPALFQPKSPRNLYPTDAELIIPPDMDESLRSAARKGNVSDLYTLIQRNGNVLRRLDEVEFIETPLHIGAEEGCMLFAMEMISLKPSFARKLNQQGLSPIHLAVQKGHKEMTLRLLEIDTDLAHVKEKNGETPLHYICIVGDHDGFLDRLLEACPDSILDVTTENRTALHIAVDNERQDVLRILTRMLRKKDYRREVVNRKDEDGNTALHLAGLTTLDVAQQHNNKGNITLLRSSLIPLVSNIKCEDRSALLVILGLLLAATYQASLRPPGGVWQGGNASKKLGRSVMDPPKFLLFFIPTYIVFIVTFFLTLAQLKFSKWFQDGNSNTTRVPSGVL